jgi:hypothetical protein
LAFRVQWFFKSNINHAHAESDDRHSNPFDSFTAKIILNSASNGFADIPENIDENLQAADDPVALSVLI